MEIRVRVARITSQGGYEIVGYYWADGYNYKTVCIALFLRMAMKWLVRMVRMAVITKNYYTPLENDCDMVSQNGLDGCNYNDLLHSTF